MHNKWALCETCRDRKVIEHHESLVVIFLKQLLLLILNRCAVLQKPLNAYATKSTPALVWLIFCSRDLAKQ